MQLYHESNESNLTPNDRGTFDEFLFFSTEAGVHETVGGNYTYVVSVDDEKIMDADRLFWDHEITPEIQEIIHEIVARYDVDEDTARDLLDETIDDITDVVDFDDGYDAADASWDIQRLTAKAAKSLGYSGVCVSDEHGWSYMIDVVSNPISQGCQMRETA